MNQRTSILIILLFSVCFLSCKREKEFKSVDLKSNQLPNGLPNITGRFNAYGYQDDIAGFVPLEVVDVTYDETVNEIVAVKLLGDKAVTTGMITFRGVYKKQYFEVMTTVWDFLRQVYINVPHNIVVDNENAFTMHSIENGTTCKFIRRVEK